MMSPLHAATCRRRAAPAGVHEALPLGDLSAARPSRHFPSSGPGRAGDRAAARRPA